jgi:small conductance mechanosensitive channel
MTFLMGHSPLLALISEQVLTQVLAILPKVLSAIAVLVLTRFAIRLVSRVMNKTLRKTEPTLRKFLIQAAETSTLIVGGLAALNAVGIQATSLVAVLGAAGLAIGLAWRDTLSHFAAGVMLITMRPFEVGDVIEAAKVAGVVDAIGIFSTTIITPDNVKITVPNAQLFNGTLKNTTTLGIRRVDITVELDDRFFNGAGHSSLNDPIQQLLELVQAHPLVLQDPAPSCIVTAISPKSTELSLRPWCDAENYEQVRSDLYQWVQEWWWRSIQGSDYNPEKPGKTQDKTAPDQGNLLPNWLNWRG